MECHIFLIYQKLTVQDFNFQLFGILRVSTLRFGGSPVLLITFYSNPSGRGVANLFSHKQLKPHICFHFTREVWQADSPLPAIFGKKICIIHKRYKRSFKSRMASYFTKLQYDK